MYSNQVGAPDYFIIAQKTTMSTGYCATFWSEYSSTTATCIPCTTSSDCVGRSCWAETWCTETVLCGDGSSNAACGESQQQQSDEQEQDPQEPGEEQAQQEPGEEQAQQEPGEEQAQQEPAEELPTQECDECECYASPASSFSRCECAKALTNIRRLTWPQPTLRASNRERRLHERRCRRRIHPAHPRRLLHAL